MPQETSFFKWQYDLRWAAQNQRAAGKLQAVEGLGVWRLSLGLGLEYTSSGPGFSVVRRKRVGFRFLQPDHALYLSKHSRRIQ